MKMLAKVSGNGEPVVLVPGGLTGWLDWSLHARHLVKTNQIIRVQLVSVQYGLENWPLPDDYTVKTESRALASTLNDLGISNDLNIAGWSYGGVIALDYALDNPATVRSLTLIEPPAYWVLHELGELDVIAKEAMLNTWSMFDDISEVELERFLRKVGLCATSQAVHELPQWQLWARHRQSIRAVSATFMYKDRLKRLHDFLKPVLLVKGTGSISALHKIIDALSFQLPQAQVAEMPGGHAPQIVSSDTFLKRFNTFITDAN
jgi:pimeloyl-ACP methyl ester carboxylesterase